MPLVTPPPSAGCCGEAAGATAPAAVGPKPCCAEASGSTAPAFDAVLRDAAEALTATMQRPDAGAAAASLTAAEASTSARLMTRAATTEA